MDPVFSKAAVADLRDLVDWYDQQQSGLGSEFLGCVDAAVHLLCRHPEIGSEGPYSCRRLLIRRFPVTLYFRHCDDGITIVAILHHRRKTPVIVAR